MLFSPKQFKNTALSLELTVRKYTRCQIYVGQKRSLPSRWRWAIKRCYQGFRAGSSDCVWM